MERRSAQGRLDDVNAELISNMRARVAKCRRLAQYINDPRTTEALLKMAEEGEADIRRLEEQGAAEMQIPPPQLT